MGDDNIHSPLETTRWHWIMMFVIPFGIFLASILPHSFGTVIGKVVTRQPRLLVTMDVMTSITSAIPFLSLPFLLTCLWGKRRYCQVFGTLGFILLAISNFSTSALEANNPYILFFTYSFLYGVGGALIITVCMIQLGDYFLPTHRYFVMATSAFQLGYPLASGIGNPLVAFLIEKTSWQGTFTILGMMYLLLGTVVGVLMKPLNQAHLFHCPLLSFGKPKGHEILPEMSATSSNDNSLAPVVEKKMSVCDRFRTTPQVFPWFLGKFLNYASWFAIRTNIVTYLSTSIHLSLQDSANLMTVYATAEIAATLIGVVIGPFLSGNLLLVHIFSTAGLTGTCFAWLYIVTNYATAFVGMIVLGLFIQLSLTYGYPTSVEITGWEGNLAWSTTLFIGGLGTLASTLIGGLPSRLYGQIDVMFLVIGATSAGQLVCYLTTFIIIFYRRMAAFKPAAANNSYEEIK